MEKQQSQEPKDASPAPSIISADPKIDALILVAGDQGRMELHAPNPPDSKPSEKSEDFSLRFTRSSQAWKSPGGEAPAEKTKRTITEAAPIGAASVRGGTGSHEPAV